MIRLKEKKDLRAFILIEKLLLLIINNNNLIKIIRNKMTGIGIESKINNL